MQREDVRGECYRCSFRCRHELLAGCYELPGGRFRCSKCRDTWVGIVYVVSDESGYTERIAARDIKGALATYMAEYFDDAEYETVELSVEGVGRWVAEPEFSVDWHFSPLAKHEGV